MVRSEPGHRGEWSLADPEERDSALKNALERILHAPAGLNAIAETLASSPVDLRVLADTSRRHPAATAELLRVCNSSLFSLAETITSLEQATIVFGADTVRTLILGWGVVEEVSRCLPPLTLHAFWQHGLTVALISERLASRLRYPALEAHLAGFLHDVGRAPILMAAESQGGDASAVLNARESIEAEVETFGIDHCELGRRIGIVWRFPDVFVRVFSRHHGVGPPGGERTLVRIVTEAENICAGRSAGYRSEVGIPRPFNQDLLQSLELELVRTAEHLKPDWELA